MSGGLFELELQAADVYTSCMNRFTKLIFTVVTGLGVWTSPLPAQLGDLGFDLGGLVRAAESGDAESQFQLGVRLALGEGAKKNPEEGAKWLEKAANGGHAKAMHVLGSLYDEGAGVEQSPELAAKWYQRAVEKDLPDAMMALAMLLQNGRGVEKNAEKATELAKKAADADYTPAQTFYASKLVQGDGVAKNPSKGAVWYLKAAKQDHPFAQRQLAYLYYTGNGVPLDYERCQAWYRRAVTVSQDPWAKNDLAWFLSTCPDSKFHNAEEAISTAKSAVMALEVDAGQQRHEMIDTMAAALARNDQFPEAIVWQKRSLSLLLEDKDATPEEVTKLKAEFNDRLKQYQSKKPYTEKPASATPDAEPLFNDTILQDGNSSESPERDPLFQQRPKGKGKKNNNAA